MEGLLTDGFGDAAFLGAEFHGFKVLMMELVALHLKCKHRDAGIQKDFPNAAFGLPNGRKWTPKGMGEAERVVVQIRLLGVRWLPF